MLSKLLKKKKKMLSKFLIININIQKNQIVLYIQFLYIVFIF